VTVSEPIRIDKPKALELLRAAVATRGRDYVYQRSPKGACRYANADGPSCLVGEALAQAGADVVGLFYGKSLNTKGITALSHNAAYYPSGAKFDAAVSIDAEAAAVFSEAQEAQDSGETWGAALAYAEAS
jgi:hypothetical protein